MTFLTGLCTNLSCFHLLNIIILVSLFMFRDSGFEFKSLKYSTLVFGYCLLVFVSKINATMIFISINESFTLIFIFYLLFSSNL